MNYILYFSIIIIIKTKAIKTVCLDCSWITTGTLTRGVVSTASVYFVKSVLLQIYPLQMCVVGHLKLFHSGGEKGGTTMGLHSVIVLLLFTNYYASKFA